MDLSICPSCGRRIADDDDYCGHCGTHRIQPEENYCINPNCERYQVILSDSDHLFCGKCGQPTSLGKKIEDLL